MLMRGMERVRDGPTPLLLENTKIEKHIRIGLMGYYIRVSFGKEELPLIPLQ
jgi:hypothetical protein